MTNVYNGLIENLEHALGHMQRHDTEAVLTGLDGPQSPPALIRRLLAGNPHVRQWKEEHAEALCAHEKARQEAGADADAPLPPGVPDIVEAQEIAHSIIAPVFARDTRSDYYTRSGGNLLTGLYDLWVQQERFDGDTLRSAHIVEYDLVNMEAVLMAAEKMLGAIDEANHGRQRRSRTTPRYMTDGYMRIVNGLVYEAFAAELEKAGIGNVAAHLHPMRLSNGDEFRLVVVGLDDDQVAQASRKAQERVQQFVTELGFDALPHLKHMKDPQRWDNVAGVQDIMDDPGLYKAFKYGGAGIKIGSTELGLDRTTAEIEQELDVNIHANREARASRRAACMDAAIEVARAKDPMAPPPRLFNPAHKLAHYGMGTILFADPRSFSEAMKVIKQDEYRGYYRRPDVESLEFPYKLAAERNHAFPYNNPDQYVDAFIQVAADYVTLGFHTRKRLENALATAFENMGENMGEDTAARPRELDADQVAAIFMHTLRDVLEESHPPSEMPDVLKARAQLEDKQLLLREAISIYAGTWNPYESFDLTRRRILDREADRLHLNKEQREVLFHAPLALENARHEDGYCMNGRIKSALQVFQANDQQLRQFSYIGLSSFAGVNEVSTALARSVNEEIRGIAAGELRQRFGRQALDFAFAVDSGRLNVLTHGIAKNDLVEALCEIERRVDREINQVPLERLLKRYHVFCQPSDSKVLVARDAYDRDIARIQDDVYAAEERYGQDTPLVFEYTTQGEVTARPLSDEETAQQQEALAAGRRLFLMERGHGSVLRLPDKAVEYLKSVGYSNAQGELDLSRPLAILPNPKHTHEHGVRAVTAYVELLGRSASLADQRKDELYRLVSVKKRSLYEPGRGYEMLIPVEAMPNIATPETGREGAGKAATAVGDGKFTGQMRNMAPAKDATAGGPAIKGRQIKPSGPFVPRDQAGWLRQLDQKEFEMLQQRNVPETLLQVITDSYVDVEHNGSARGFVIHVHRQNKGYDREDPEIPYRRAAFIKHALTEHFGGDIAVTGLPNNKVGKRSITMHVKPGASNGKASYQLDQLPTRQQEMVHFFNALCDIKERQDEPDLHKEGIARELREQIDSYRHQLRAINLLRHFPTMHIDVPRNKGGYFVIKLPQEPGERKTVWKQRNDALLREMRKLITDKAVDFEEQQEMPMVVRTGGNSLKSRIKYQIRVESTPVSDELMEYMASLQQSQNVRSNVRGA